MSTSGWRRCQGTGESDSELKCAETALLSPCIHLTRARGVQCWLPCGRRPLAHIILPIFDPDLQHLHVLLFLFITIGSNNLLVHGKFLSMLWGSAQEWSFFMMYYPRSCFSVLHPVMHSSHPLTTRHLCYFFSIYRGVWNRVALVGRLPWPLLYLPLLVGYMFSVLPILYHSHMWHDGN